MVWPVWVSVAVIVALLTWRSDPRPALLLLLGLFAMRLAPVMPYDLRLVASAGLWVAIGGLIVTALQKPCAGLLVVASGLCYLWAWILRAPIAFGSAPFVASDILGASALLVLGWGARDVVMGWLSNRGYRRDMAWRFDRRGDNFGHSNSDVAAAKGEK